MDTSTIGNSAAIAVAFLWTGSSLFFTEAGKRVGFFCVNAYRSIITVGLLICAHLVLLGYVLPAATGQQWLWLGLSGIVGLGIGDFGLFAGYILIGPKKTLLVMASSPIFASIGAYLILGETFPQLAVLGIALTLTGIIIVLLEKENGSSNVANNSPQKRRSWGIFAALVATAGQGIGLVLSKEGMIVGPSSTLNPVSAALIRIMIATVFVWACSLSFRKASALKQTARDTAGLKFVFGGAIVGPFLGMTLSLFAVSYTATGIAQTLISLEPLIIIPFVWILYKERTSWRGIAGAALAIAGVAILMLT